MKLLTRDEFREACLKRDKGSCVVCGCKENLSVHHILERRLWNDGGYYSDNGATLCEKHHLDAEMTVLSCADIRKAIGITQIILPDHISSNDEIDKWGNPILPNGMRMRGELFQEEPVQKMLAAGNVLALFTKYVKYPRTYHLPWSPGRSDDDKVLPDCSQFEGREVVVTVKMDGENTTMYPDYLHARSLEYHAHPSRSRIKQLHATMAHEIPEGWRICGENLFAKHSIHYSNLESHFNMFSIWNERNFCLSWEETKEWANLLGLSLVPVLYQGIWDEAQVKKLYSSEFDGNQCEGYVVRVADQFHYRRFKECVGKFVRASHVTTDEHWLQSELVPNLLRK